MADNANNQDPKSSQNPSHDESDFWDLSQDSPAADTSIDADDLDLESIQTELSKDITYQKVDKPVTNLKEAELQMNQLDEAELMTTLDTASNKQEEASAPDLTDEELSNFRAAENVEVVRDESGKSSFLEKIMMTLCFAGIIGFGAYMIHYLYDKFEIKTEKDWASNIPVKGKFASIDAVKTWWTVPQNNNTQFGIELVPAVTVTLGSDSKSGVLRAVFYSYEESYDGKPRAKGDPFPLAFENGKFVATGKNTITIYGTDGFTDVSNFEYYRTQNDDRWTITLREAAPGETNADKFAALGKAPIEPIRIGTKDSKLSKAKPAPEAQ